MRHALSINVKLVSLICCFFLQSKVTQSFFTWLLSLIFQKEVDDSRTFAWVWVHVCVCVCVVLWCKVLRFDPRDTNSTSCSFYTRCGKRPTFIFQKETKVETFRVREVYKCILNILNLKTKFGFVHSNIKQSVFQHFRGKQNCIDKNMMILLKVF